jgi:hypothetical protein
MPQLFLAALVAVTVAVAVAAVTNIRPFSKQPPTASTGLVDANKEFYR